MAFKVMPRYFLVRIDKKKQEYLKTHVSQNSLIYVPLGSVHQSRNMEHGILCQIGDKMKDIYGFENLRVGHILLFHWQIERVSGKPQDKQYFVYEDETYSYYVVDEDNVRGYFDGEKIVPHPNFVFLKNIPAFESEGEYDENLNAYLKDTGNGLVVFSDWNKSPQRYSERVTNIKNQIAGLIKSTRTPEIQSKLEELEKEKQQINKELQKNKYLPYKLAYCNKKMDTDCGIKLKEDDIIYAFNKAALYITNFQNKEYSYIIVNTEQIGCFAPIYANSNTASLALSKVSLQ